MFEEETVFILGAGASWHYGYPTGAELIEEVKRMARSMCLAWRKFNIDDYRYRPEYFSSMKNLSMEEARQKFVEQCEDLYRRLIEANPVSIDSFLNKNKGVNEIGRIVISYIILSREQKSFDSEELDGSGYKKLPGDDLKREGKDWQRYFLEAITNGCDEATDLSKNNVNVITFNYDVSFENRLFRGLESLELFEHECKKKFYESEFVHHVYGKVRSNGFENREYGTFAIGSEGESATEAQMLDRAWKASTDIRIIGDEREVNQDVVDLLTCANRVFILGYGFNHENNVLLDLDQSLKATSDSKKRIFFCNFRNLNRVNKLVGKLILNDPTRFVKEDMYDSTRGGEGGFYVEKSSKDVYGALSEDFDIF